MMTTTTHSLVEQYLRRLDNAARSLPRQQREELMAEIREHLSTGLAPDATEAEVRNLLDDLGTPSAIIAAAQPDGPVVKRGAREAFAVVFLLLGFPPVLGWLIGFGLLLWSPLWSIRQKLLGALVWPGGLMTVGLAGGVLAAAAPAAKCTPGVFRLDTAGQTVSTVVESCTSSGTPPWVLIAVAVLVVPPAVVAAYLYRAAGRNTVPG